jgi:hypothetical protein
MKVNIDYQNSTDLITPNYRGDCDRQMPIWLEIDWENKEITAYTRNFRVGGTPANIWHGRADVYHLPNNTDASRLKGWVESDVIPRIKSLEAAYESYWDGSNWRGRWKDDDTVETIYDDFHEFMSSQEAGNGSVPAILDGGGVWDVWDWLQDLPEGLDANTTDAELDAIAKEILSEANCQDIVLDGDVVAFLKNRREDLKNE